MISRDLFDWDSAEMLGVWGDRFTANFLDDFQSDFQNDCHGAEIFSGQLTQAIAFPNGGKRTFAGELMRQCLIF